MRTKWEITLPILARGEATQIIRDGEDITAQVRSISIHAAVDAATTVTVEYISDLVSAGVEVEE